MSIYQTHWGWEGAFFERHRLHGNNSPNNEAPLPPWHPPVLSQRKTNVKFGREKKPGSFVLPPPHLHCFDAARLLFKTRGIRPGPTQKGRGYPARGGTQKNTPMRKGQPKPVTHFERFKNPVSHLLRGERTFLSDCLGKQFQIL